MLAVRISALFETGAVYPTWESKCKRYYHSHTITVYQYHIFLCEVCFPSLSFFKENKKKNISSHSLREQNLLMSFCTKKRQLFGPCGHQIELKGSQSVALPRGASGETCRPPQPWIGHPARSMQIREDFHVGKMGICLQDCSHVLHAPTLRLTFFGLMITKKEGVVEVLGGVTLVGPE